MNRSPKKWHATVLSSGLESAIVDKYADLFAADPILAQAWADHQAAEARIHARMDALAATSPPPDAAHGPMTKAPSVDDSYWYINMGRNRALRAPWCGDDLDRKRLRESRCFRTEADARAALQAEKGKP